MTQSSVATSVFYSSALICLSVGATRRQPCFYQSDVQPVASNTLRASCDQELHLAVPQHPSGEEALEKMYLESGSKHFFNILIANKTFDEADEGHCDKLLNVHVTSLGGETKQFCPGEKKKCVCVISRCGHHVKTLRQKHHRRSGVHGDLLSLVFHRFPEQLSLCRWKKQLVEGGRKNAVCWRLPRWMSQICELKPETWPPHRVRIIPLIPLRHHKDKVIES